MNSSYGHVVIVLRSEKHNIYLSFKTLNLRPVDNELFGHLQAEISYCNVYFKYCRCACYSFSGRYNFMSHIYDWIMNNHEMHKKQHKLN